MNLVFVSVTSPSEHFSLSSCELRTHNYWKPITNTSIFIYLQSETSSRWDGSTMTARPPPINFACIDWDWWGFENSMRQVTWFYWPCAVALFTHTSFIACHNWDRTASECWHYQYHIRIMLIHHCCWTKCQHTRPHSPARIPFWS